MKDFSKFWDAVYVINLDHRTDRWDSISGMAKAAGFQLERYSAFPAAKVEFDKHLIGIRIKKETTIACGLSHLGVYREALKQGHKKILVLEDDADIPNDLYEQLEDFFEKTNLKNFEVLYLGCADKYPSAPLDENIALSQFSLLAHAYIITREAMEYLVDMNDTRDEGKIRMSADVLLAEELQPRNTCFQIRKNIVKVIPSKSDIAGCNRNWESLVRDCLTQGLKNPKKWESFEKRAKDIKTEETKKQKELF